ncbi:hypothetical protein DWF00_20210 [Bosea caraganae]|uniref:Uncharacterized protein n=1 Tax=Bosea caraganae TaxID=2763117 RepID=A0A370KZ86_9HYPH|nr:hypothetical protein DWE98_25500 [Bosea caraganae]RDJ24015.1 hypothetical protein DWF00_20210 [Bosea caraganae]
MFGGRAFGSIIIRSKRLQMTAVIEKRIRTFFDAYASASLAGDAKTVSDAYHSTYIEAAPSTVEVFNVDAEYKRAVSSKAEAMNKLGLVGSKIVVIDTTQLAPNHHWVDAEWRLGFGSENDKTAETAFRIGYLVRRQGNDLKILLALSHEDEEEALHHLTTNLKAMT